MTSIRNHGIHLKQCAKCKVVFYCGVECQREDWTFHKLECKCFKRVFPLIPSEFVILFSRLVQRHNRGEHKTVSETICGRKVVFNDLVHHVEDIKKDESRLLKFHTCMEYLQSFLGGRLAFPTSDEMLKMFGRVQVNAFGITSDDDGQATGIGLFLGLSAIDHSCRPNAEATVDGVIARVRTLIDVPDSLLETYCNKVRISYIDQLNLTEERRSILRERYYFTCDCSMCSDQTMDAMMQSIKCPQLTCDGALIRQEADQAHMCTTCNAEFHDKSDVITKYNLLVTTTKSTLQGLEELKENRQSEELFHRAEQLIRLQENTFYKMNVYRVKTFNKAVDGAFHTKRWNKANEYALPVLDAYKHFLEEYNPKVGSHLMRMGLAQLYFGQTREAAAFLQQAESILAVTHGSGHRIYDFLKERRDECLEMLT